MSEVNLVPSLLQAIVNIDGEALVMHAGDKPYVVSPTGQVELASRGLTLDAVSGIVAQLLPAEFQHALDEFGAVQYTLPPRAEFPQEQFTVVVARGGDDVWAEIRRKRVLDDRVSRSLVEPAPLSVSAAAPIDLMNDDDFIEIEVRGSDQPVVVDEALALPEADHFWPGMSHREDVYGEEDEEIELTLPHKEPALLHVPETPSALVPPPIRAPLPPPPVAVTPLPAVPATPAAPARPVALPIAASVGVKPVAPSVPPVVMVEAVRSAPIAPLPVAVAPAPEVVIAPAAVAPMIPSAPVRLAAPPVPSAVTADPVRPAPTAPPPPPAAVVLPPVVVTPPPPAAVVLPTAVVTPPPPAAVVLPSVVVTPPPPAAVVLPPVVVMPSPPAAVMLPPVVVPTPPAAAMAQQSAPAIASAMPAAPDSIPAVSVEAVPLSVPLAVIFRSSEPMPTVPPLPMAVAPPASAKPPVPAMPPAPLRPEPIPPPQPRLTPPPAVVLPMSRSPIRIDAPSFSVPVGDTLSGLERLLRTASARGASTLYLSSDARPSVRVDGGLQSLDSEPVLTSNDVISLLLTLMPDRSHETLRTGATTEWICDIEDIGRVRCMSFSDHRGPGGVFRLMPVRSVSVDHLSLGPEIQSLAIEPEGLVVIAGSRSSGKRTLVSALVDLINRTRHDHVITIEREVNIVHDRRSSFISQREVRGGDDEVLAAARAALREDPDVLVLEQIRTEPLMSVALEAAALGHLVIAGFSAHNVTKTIDRVLDFYTPEHSRQVQLALADNLRGVVAQVLLPKIGGGRVVAREVLLNTPAVAGVIAEGKTSQLPMAIEGGRRLGMVPLHDALENYVQNGVVDIRDAYRHVSDRPAFLAFLKRQGIDTSALERPA